MAEVAYKDVIEELDRVRRLISELDEQISGSTGLAEVLAEGRDRLDRIRSQLLDGPSCSEKRVENIKTVLWGASPRENRILYVSPVYEEIWGRTCESLHQDPTSWITAVHPDDRARVQEAASRAADGQGFDEEFRIHRPDGSVRWIHDRGVPVWKSDGTISQIAGIAEDVTERKQAEEVLNRARVELEQKLNQQTEQLITANEKWRSVVEHAPDYITVVDREGLITFINHVAPSVVMDDVVGKLSIYTYTDPIHHIRITQALQAAFEQCESTEYEVYCPIFDTWYVCRMGPMQSEGGVASAIILSRDITKRKKDEQALRDSEARFRGYFELGLIGISITSPEKGWVEVNDRLCEILGHTRSELLQKTWAEITHPDDLAEDVKQFERVLAGEIDGYSMEKRFIQKDGTVIHSSIDVKCLRLDDGKVDYFVEMIQDITDRKLSEEALRESEERLDLAVRGTSDGVWDWEIKTGSEHWSPRFKELLGYAENEIEASYDQFLALLHPDEEADVREAIRLHLEENQPYDREFRMRTKSGEYRWFHSRGEALRDERGRPYRMAGSIRDISERRQTDDLLKALVEGTASATGAEFFASFARALAGVYGARYVVVCEHLDSPVTRVRTLAFWKGDHLGENIDYDLAGGPCEETAKGEMTYYPHGIQEHFPDDKDLVELGAESYCGLPVADSTGEVIGHLAILDDRPLDINLCEVPALQIFVSRAAAELERKRAVNALRESELRLKTVISSAPIVITSVNQNGEIDLFDGRALESIGYEPGQFVGKDYFKLWQERPYMTSSMRECLAGGTPAHTTMDIANRLLETRYSPIKTADGEISGAIAVCVDVTERLRAEEALRESNRRFRRLSEAAFEAILVHEDGVLVTANDQFFEMFGRSLSDLSGEELIPTLIAPEAIDHVREQISSGTEKWYESVGLRIDGTRFPMEIRVRNTEYEGRSVRVAAIMDITEQKRAEEELRRYEKIVSSSADVLAMLDENFVYLAANDAYRKAFRLAPGDLIGRTAIELFGEEFFEDVIRPAAERCLSGESVSYQEWFDFPVEGKMYMDVNYYPYLDRDGEVKGFVVNGRDITERIRAEEQARKHRDVLAHVTRISTMGEMATGIAHELNQPLAAISLYSDTARTIAGRSGLGPGELSTILGKLEDQAIRAGDIVRRLRDYVKKTGSVRVPADLNTLVEDVARFVEPDIRKAEANLVVQIQEPSPSVLVDQIQIQQVLVNLIRNAVDAMQETPTGQREVIVSTRVLQDGRSEVVVSDVGKGLARDELDQAFNAFFSTMQEGLGMGLPISRSIVEAHGGKLWVEPNAAVLQRWATVVCVHRLPQQKRHQGGLWK